VSTVTAGAADERTIASVPGALFARTVELPAEVGVRLAAAAPHVIGDGEATSSHGFGLLGPRGVLLGLGAATQVELADGFDGASAAAIADQLAQVTTVDPVGRPGSGPLAVGSLPFDARSPAAVVVPALAVVRRSGGAAWATVTGPEPVTTSEVLDAVEAVLTAAEHAGGEPPLLTPTVSHWQLDPTEAAFESCVADALAAIATGEVTKVVLARSARAVLDRPIDVADLVARLRQREPACTVFVERRGSRYFVGATPELLVRRRGLAVVSHPLAGTASRALGAREALARLARPKELAEHAAAAEAVAAALRPWCSTVDVPAHPAPVWLASLVHLGTRITATLRCSPDRAAATAWGLAAALHPTPAVAGVPTDAALALISRLETTSRGPYAGPIGWMDRRGDGDVLVALRGVAIAGLELVAHAGVGIVAGSDPHNELVETTAKLNVAMGALGLDAAGVRSR
jgi:menaquinone-specific isochorismate synthase